MLQAGLHVVAQRGLSLSVDHLRMEDLIQAAGVSRTSSYRRWPTKDLFAADLLVRLAGATDLSGEIPGLIDALESIPTELLGRLNTSQGRHDLIVEIVRVMVETDFAAMLLSAEWKAYVALRAAYLGVLGGDLRARVADALSAAERRATRHRAETLTAVTRLLGYRLRPDGATTWEQLSLTLNAVATGLLIHAYADPASVTEATQRQAFGSTRHAAWSSATSAEAGILLGAIEPDPDQEWTAARVTALRSQLADPLVSVDAVRSLRDASDL